MTKLPDDPLEYIWEQGRQAGLRQVINLLENYDTFYQEVFDELPDMIEAVQAIAQQE